MPSTAQVWFDNTIKLLIALIVLLGTMGLLYLVLTGQVSDNKDVLLLIIGWATGTASTIMTYYYGSSAGSAQKTAAGIGVPPAPPPPGRSP